MRKLSRKNVKEPADWKTSEKKATTDLTLYRKMARQFESLPIDSTKHKAGFLDFAKNIMPKNKKGDPVWRNIWREAREPIGNMSADKCAYCETMLTSAGDEQIEHFKPKSRFPSLAYRWSNYFIACGGCNRSKGNKWPKKGSYVRPDTGKPEDWFVFDEDGSVRATRADARRTVDDFKFNRQLLLKWRRRAIRRNLDVLRDLLDMAPRREAQKWARREIRRFTTASNPFSAALFQCAERVWKKKFPRVKLGVRL